MLLSTVFKLRPMTDCHVPMTLGKAIHACFLQMVRRLDPCVGSRLHSAEQVKPFTTSPLQGPFEVRKHHLLLKQDREYWLRVTSLEGELSQLLLHFEQTPPSCLNLLGAKFEVTNVSSQAQQHAWARRSTYEELQEPQRSCPETPSQKVSVVFASPTAFRSQGQTVLLPLPRLVFSSLWERWQRYAPYRLDPALIEAMIAEVDIARYKLQTQMMVALPLTVVTSTSVQPGVAVPVRDARAAWVVSTEAVAHATRAVPGRSSSGRGCPQPWRV